MSDEQRTLFDALDLGRNTVVEVIRIPDSS
jgi:hypothetical protein